MSVGSRPEQSGALSGVTIVDASSLAAAPLASTYLAEFGARVVKVEDPSNGDPIRKWARQKNGIGLLWKSVNRNKECVSINLRDSRGQDLLRKLVAEMADAVVLNNRPETLKKWGLSYEDLRAVNPEIIMLHLTAFGLDGPYSHRPGFGTLGEAMSGFAHTTGFPDGPPVLPSFPLADSVASLFASQALLVALYHRDALKGSGQLIEVNLLEPLARLLEYNVLEYDQLGIIPMRPGNRWRVTAPRDAFECADGKWVAVSGSHPNAVRNILVAVGREDIAEDFARDPERRIREAEVMYDAIGAWVGARSLAQVVEHFDEHEVAYGPVYDAKQLVEDPHVIARNVYAKYADDQLGEILLQRPPALLSETPGSVQWAGKPLGADNERVFIDDLGLSRSMFEELKSSGVV